MLTVFQKLVAVAVLVVLNLFAVVTGPLVLGGVFGAIVAATFVSVSLPAFVQVVRI